MTLRSDDNLSDEPKKHTNKTRDDAGHVRRGPWSPEEDCKLMDIITQCGPSNWVRISVILGSRSPKQCRERYHQNLKPSLNRDPITYEEGLLIEELVAKNGKKWAEIARHLTGRSDNAIKNWWNGGASRRRRVAQVPMSKIHNRSPSPARNIPGSYMVVSHDIAFDQRMAEHGMDRTIDVHGTSYNTRTSPPGDRQLPSPQMLENSYVEAKSRRENSYIDLKNQIASSRPSGLAGQHSLPRIDFPPSVSFKTSMFMTPNNYSTNQSPPSSLAMKSMGQPMLHPHVTNVGRSYSIDHTSSGVQSAKRRYDDERKHSVSHTVFPSSPAFHQGPFYPAPYGQEYYESANFVTAARTSESSIASSDDMNKGSFTHNKVSSPGSAVGPNWFTSLPLDGHAPKKPKTASSAEPTPRTSDGESDTSNASTENKNVPAVRMKVSSLIN